MYYSNKNNAHSTGHKRSLGSHSRHSRQSSPNQPTSRVQEQSGLLPKAPGPYPNRYVFSNGSGDVFGSFCSCVPQLYERKSEVYVSPSQVVSREHMLRAHRLICP